MKIAIDIIISKVEMFQNKIYHIKDKVISNEYD
jgi:hypothetical protein